MEQHNAMMKLHKSIRRTGQSETGENQIMNHFSSLISKIDTKGCDQQQQQQKQQVSGEFDTNGNPTYTLNRLSDPSTANTKKSIDPLDLLTNQTELDGNLTDHVFRTVIGIEHDEERKRRVENSLSSSSSSSGYHKSSNKCQDGLSGRRGMPIVEKGEPTTHETETSTFRFRAEDKITSSLGDQREGEEEDHRVDSVGDDNKREELEDQQYLQSQHILAEGDYNIEVQTSDLRNSDCSISNSNTNSISSLIITFTSTNNKNLVAAMDSRKSPNPAIPDGRKPQVAPLNKQSSKRMKCQDCNRFKSPESQNHRVGLLNALDNEDNNGGNSKQMNLIQAGKEDPIKVRNQSSQPTFEEQQQDIMPKNRVLMPHKLVSLVGQLNGRSVSNKQMPWFGMDIGGSLVKVVFFDPQDATIEELKTLKTIRHYLKSHKPYGITGRRDGHLEMHNCVINKRSGSLHFIRFATSEMPEFLKFAKDKRIAAMIRDLCATGGGANKFEDYIKTDLGIKLHKSDELDSIIHGIHYIDKYNFERECYFLEYPLDDDKCIKVPYDFSRPYPYLVVNIGSGVSILAVYSSTSYSRISGSSIGGGTFLGLCCLLTQCKTFDEAIRLAKAGSSTKIDKLVKDIYGGDYPKFNLSGDTVASSFGHMNLAAKRKGVRKEDVARALLEMVTINIGSIARMCAANENIDRVVFIGNFLRVNQLSMKLLSYAVNYWSKGAMKALFLEHEGYFGAVGCFVESSQDCHN